MSWKDIACKVISSRGVGNRCLCISSSNQISNNSSWEKLGSYHSSSRGACRNINCSVTYVVLLHVQVKVPSLQARCHHSAAAFSLSPGLTEVTVFGGIPEWPRFIADIPQIANTTVLQFGESIYNAIHNLIRRPENLTISRHLTKNRRLIANCAYRA